MGSVSMPIGSSDDSMVKVASGTVTAALFYDRFFALVESYLPKPKPKPAKVSKAKAEEAPVKAEKPAVVLGLPEQPAAPAAAPASLQEAAPAAPASEPVNPPAAVPAADDTQGSQPVAPPAETAPTAVQPAVAPVQATPPAPSVGRPPGTARS